MDEAFLNLVVESWRFLQASHRIVDELNAYKQRAYQSKIRWFENKLKDALAVGGWQISSLENQPYNPGLPVTALNSDDFSSDPEDALFIDQMLEPVVLDNKGNLIKSGTVILRKA